jgi:hypothetical protein
MNQPQKWHEVLDRSLRIMAEHGKVTLTADPAGDDCVIQLNPEMDDVSFEQMIREFAKRYQATLEFIFEHWNEVHCGKEVH